ncbi:imidazoleglycerol phosphate synthase [Leucogyrophana mollusca]|uniref:Imidazoleglycerol phosphate synthase n=1 Tax=Leucogyrophana mollusca TaxID=85980 RepID=A0ACB8BXF2_9AGAM|nr:imidazoleglycerol phosphate synthase [Leucogyrophana mollusca]
MALFLLDHGAGNVQSLANTLRKLGYEFSWISCPEDFHKASSIIFPGQGAFGTSIEHLSEHGMLEPLREYIKSGKPYFGICVGMQVLFETSTESPSARGIGVIPCQLEIFDHVGKAVPHMGWNSADLLDPTLANSPSEAISPSAHYYFVHSYCAKYNPEKYPAAAEWAHTTTQYGQELFVSSVRKGNVFGTQFHPEKSGVAGLTLIDTWLKQSQIEPVSASPTTRVPRLPKPKDGFTKRIIACMDVRANDEGDLVVTKGDQYDVREKAIPSATLSNTTVKTAGAVRNLGKPVALAARYFEAGADELCLLNITSFRHSPLQDQPMLAVVRAAAEHIFVPLTIGGGIKDSVDPDGTKRPAVEVAGAYFRAGADKVSIGSEAVHAVEKMRAAGGKGDGTSAIETISKMYGIQAVVVSIDPKRVYVDPATYDGPYKDELVYGKPDGPETERGKAWWYQCTVSGGREARPLSAVQLAQGVQTLGAGEILLNSIDRDGTGLGFDLDLINMVKRAVTIPVVASSGAGTKEHFVTVFEEADVEAALAAGIFHREEVGIREVKDALHEAGINVRSTNSA